MKNNKERSKALDDFKKSWRNMVENFNEKDEIIIGVEAEKLKREVNIIKGKIDAIEFFESKLGKDNKYVTEYRLSIDLKNLSEAKNEFDNKINPYIELLLLKTLEDKLYRAINIDNEVEYNMSFFGTPNGVEGDWGFLFSEKLSKSKIKDILNEDNLKEVKLEFSDGVVIVLDN